MKSLHCNSFALAWHMHYTDYVKCWLWPDIETRGLSMVLELWSLHKAVMALLWP
jgi:hypothetical protein